MITNSAIKKLRQKCVGDYRLLLQRTSVHEVMEKMNVIELLINKRMLNTDNVFMRDRIMG